MGRVGWWISGASVALAAIVLTLVVRSPAGASQTTLPTPEYGERFWERWGDGQAELAGYDLIYPRYGEERRGTAVTIFVTETFEVASRVKSELPARAEGRTFPVMKLNLIQDFATGIYDYNLMTSVFVALSGTVLPRAGHPTKVSFSSQEWCGHVYSQLLFDELDVRFESHSYFDGEADERAELELPEDGLSEDALLLWARGLTAPVVGPGESRNIRLLRSLESSRLIHVDPTWVGATLTRSARTEKLTVPAGTFEVEKLEVLVERVVPPRRWTFFVDTSDTRRLIRWERDDGLAASLLGQTRAPYWTLTGPGLAVQLEKLGLRSRPARTP